MGIENSSFEAEKSQNTLKTANNIGIKDILEKETLANKLSKINNILDSISVSEKEEDEYRNILKNQDKNTIKDLSQKPKTEILTFLIKAQIEELKNKGFRNLSREEKIKFGKLKKQFIAVEKSETERVKKTDKKIEELRGALLSNPLLQDNSKIENIKQKFDDFEKAWDNDKLRQNILKSIIQDLKNPWTLKSIVKDLWWANPNNPEYQKFKNTLISVDSSFKNIFPELERLQDKSAFPTKEIFDIDWWIVDINLKDEKITTKEIWSKYAFEDELKVEELDNISSECIKEIKNFKNGKAVLKGAYAPFGKLLNQFSNGKDTSELISNFDISSFDKFNAIANKLNLDTNITISSADIYDLKNIKNKDELQLKLQSIKEKFIKLASAMEKKESEIKQKYHNEFTELLRQKAQSKKLQMKVLKFFWDIGFDKISKSKSDIIVKYINTNSWKFGLDSKMDFKNWNLGFNKDFWDKNINTLEKIEFIKLFNKMLWENIIDENIAKWTTALSLKAISKIQVLSNKTTWFFIENLKKDGP